MRVFPERARGLRYLRVLAEDTVFVVGSIVLHSESVLHFVVVAGTFLYDACQQLALFLFAG
jgi:hypothetical protein